MRETLIEEQIKSMLSIRVVLFPILIACGIVQLHKYSPSLVYVALTLSIIVWVLYPVIVTDKQQPNQSASISTSVPVQEERKTENVSINSIRPISYGSGSDSDKTKMNQLSNEKHTLDTVGLNSKAVPTAQSLQSPNVIPNQNPSNSPLCVIIPPSTTSKVNSDRNELNASENDKVINADASKSDAEDSSDDANSNKNYNETIVRENKKESENNEFNKWRCACEGGFLPPGMLKSLSGAESIMRLGTGQCYHKV